MSYRRHQSIYQKCSLDVANVMLIITPRGEEHGLKTLELLGNQTDSVPAKKVHLERYNNQEKSYIKH